MQVARIIASAIVVAFILTSAPNAAAEEWVLLTTEGEKPSRQFKLVDRDSLDRASSDSVKLQLALLFEDGRDEALQIDVAQALIDLTVNCNERSGEFTKAELQDEVGETLYVVDGPPAGGTLDTSWFGENVLNIACEDQWPAMGISFPHLRLSEVLPFWLGVEKAAQDNQN